MLAQPRQMRPNRMPRAQTLEFRTRHARTPPLQWTQAARTLERPVTQAGWMREVPVMRDGWTLETPVTLAAWTQEAPPMRDAGMPVDVMQPWLWAWTQVVQMPQRRREMARWTPQTLLA